MDRDINNPNNFYVQKQEYFNKSDDDFSQKASRTFQKASRTFLGEYVQISNDVQKFVDKNPVNLSCLKEVLAKNINKCLSDFSALSISISEVSKLVQATSIEVKDFDIKNFLKPDETASQKN